MASSSTEIANSALIKVGADRIDSLSDNNKRARLVNERYDSKRKNLLIGHPWKFALKRISLSADVATPEWEYNFQFTLPTDCLRVVKTNLLVDQEWKVEGRKLLAQEDTIKFLYIYDVTDTTEFPEYFSEALAFDIARDIAYAITQSNTRADVINKDFKEQLRTARSFSAQEGTVEQVEAFDWTSARF